MKIIFYFTKKKNVNKNFIVDLEKEIYTFTNHLDPDRRRRHPTPVQTSKPKALHVVMLPNHITPWWGC